LAVADVRRVRQVNSVLVSATAATEATEATAVPGIAQVSSRVAPGRARAIFKFWKLLLGEHSPCRTTLVLLSKPRSQR
jgi:hypothetical protein